MNEEDRIKICLLNALVIKWDYRCTDKIISGSIYVAWFFPFQVSISVQLMLAWTRPCMIIPLNIAELWTDLWHRVASHPALARAPSRQWLGISFLNRFVLLFPFWKRLIPEESVWPVSQEEEKSKQYHYLGAAKWNLTPHLHCEFYNELADLAVILTQVTQLGKCQEHLFWEQEVHLMKMAGLFSILCTLIIFQIPIFSKRPYWKFSDLPSWQKIMVSAISKWWNYR